MERQLGAGGMGVVHLALSPTGRRVAVKVIRAEYAADPDFRTRFAREVTAARAVSGAYTASVLDADVDAERPWLATEFVDAPTLAARVRQRGPLAAAEVWQLAYGLAEALRDIHRAGVVHRDLKPANVLLAENGPRVIDFGISRSHDGSTLTTTGRLIGTPPFMAPEQIQDPAATGPAADLFALGSVLTYAAIGRGPFDAEEMYAAAFNVVFKEPALGDLPDDLRALITWCLQKNPEDRPGPDEVLEFLRSPDARTLPALGTVPSPTAAPATAPGPAASPVPKRRRPALLMSLGAVALAVVTVLGSLLWNSSTGQARSSAGPTVSSSTGSPVANSSRTPPTVTEPADAPRPRGWAVWERSWSALNLPADGPSASLRVGCRSAEPVLVCVADTRLVAVDPRTGQALWHATAPGGGHWGASEVSADARVVVVLALSNITGLPGQLTAVGLSTTTGAVLWRSPALSMRNDMTATPDAVDAGHTVLLLGDHYLALDTTGPTARILWSRPYPQGGLTYAVQGAPDVAVERSSRTALIRFDLGTGKIQWRRVIPAHASLNLPSPLPSSGGALVLPESGPELSRVTAYTTVNLTTGATTSRPLSRPLDGTAYFGTDILVAVRGDGHVAVASLATGRPGWTQTLNDDVASTLVSGDRVYLRDRLARITCLSLTDGRLLWSSTPRQSPSGPDLRSDALLSLDGGLILTTTGRSSIVALRPPT